MEKYLPEELEISYSHQLTGSESIKLVSNSTFLIKHDTHKTGFDSGKRLKSSEYGTWRRITSHAI